MFLMSRPEIMTQRSVFCQFSRFTSVSRRKFCGTSLIWTVAFLASHSQITQFNACIRMKILCFFLATCYSSLCRFISLCYVRRLVIVHSIYMDFPSFTVRCFPEYLHATVRIVLIYATTFFFHVLPSPFSTISKLDAT